MTDTPSTSTEKPSPEAPRRPAWRRPLGALADSVRFFTRLPVPARLGGAGAFSGIAAASPIAGAIVGAASALGLVLALMLGLPSAPAAVAAAALGLLVSGALHLDGLADVADGFGGGSTRIHKLEIMRDSRLGTYGGAALVLALAARITLIAALVDRHGAADAALAVIAAAVIARPLAFLPTLLLDPARQDGLGHGASPRPLAVLGATGAAVLAVLLLGGLAAGIAAVALAAAAAAALAGAARRHIGGHTGDVCGATAELAEIAALTGLLAAAIR